MTILGGYSTDWSEVTGKTHFTGDITFNGTDVDDFIVNVDVTGNVHFNSFFTKVELKRN